MPCKPRDLLTLAKELQTANTGEVADRCVVSRAYYAALHSVKTTFEERSEFKIDGESSHAEIIGRATAYSSQGKPGRTSAATIAKLMVRLRRERNIADYDIHLDYGETLSEDALARAEQILVLCDDVETKRAAMPVDPPLETPPEPPPSRPNKPALKRIM